MYMTCFALYTYFGLGNAPSTKQLHLQVNLPTAKREAQLILVKLEV